MKASFTVEILDYKVLKELPNAWEQENYLELLEALDFEDTSGIAPYELKEMCMMALTDNEPEKAARIVIDYVFKDRLKSGQKDNLSNEITKEKIWEEYADLSMHEDFFNVTQLLYEAFNGKFPHPQAVSFQVQVTAKKESDLDLFEENIEATLLRLLVKGMPENTLINRLFKDDITGTHFSEAKDIIWQLKKQEPKGNSVVFEVISSTYWFHDLKFVKTFNSITYCDIPLSKDDER